MSAERVWQRLVEILEGMPGSRTDESLAEQDRTLAADVRAAPGVLEQQFLAAGTDDLAARACADSSFPSLLGYFWNLSPPGDPFAVQYPRLARGLPATFAAMAPAPMLRAYAAARQRSARLGAITRQNSVRLAGYFLERAGPANLDGLALPAEHRDVLRALVDRAPLPDVLPLELTAWSPARISGTLADYAGMSIDDLEARLRPGGSSRSGFLAPGESLGDVIHRDAVALASHGVSRHAVADRIDVAVEGHWHTAFTDERASAELREQQHRREQRLRAWLGRPPRINGKFDLPFVCMVTVFAGHQQDPFHSTDTYGLGGVRRGACDFAITNPALEGRAVVHGSDLMTVLIRRYGFFQGAVPHRVDPAHAAWALGLTDARRSTPPPPARG